MESLRIVALAVVAAVSYGILQDLVTTRVCIEYFTIGHPRIIASESPVVLAFLWGTIATWWVGLPLGGVLALASRLGVRRRLSWRQILRPLLTLMVAIGVLSAVAGVIGYGLARADWVTLSPRLASSVPAERHAVFLADGAAHLMAYAAGIVGGFALCAITWRRRSTLEKSRSADSS